MSFVNKYFNAQKKFLYHYELFLRNFIMAANVSNIEVVLNHDIKDIPYCPHGPTLLFERYGGGGEVVKRFFACSAFRDRKECPFFQWHDENISEAKKESREAWNHAHQPPFSHKNYCKRLQKFKKLTDIQRAFCKNCCLLLLPEERSDHDIRGHKLQCPLTNQMLSHPTQLFSPIDNNKTFAQYLFSKSAVDFFIKTLCEIGITDVLCVGTPRLHEAIQNMTSEDRTRPLHSLLLDLDHRYMQLYPAELFCQYNMFNHHFFGGEKSQKVFSDFLIEGSDRRVAMVIDPPFGGMVEALAATVNKISSLWIEKSNKPDKSQLQIFWIFPYFMEKRITQCLPDLRMLDYKVGYDNHALFTGGPMSKKKKKSPVRIFTNIAAADIVLPSEEGYWFCEKCLSYSAPENKHCVICGVCTSKDGTTYVHCEKCQRCVKPSQSHCDSCDMCQQQDHKCGVHKPVGCHICSSLEHKRRNCPRKHIPCISLKTKNDGKDEPPSKRRKFNKQRNTRKKKLNK